MKIAESTHLELIDFQKWLKSRYAASTVADTLRQVCPFVRSTYPHPPTRKAITAWLVSRKLTPSMWSRCVVALARWCRWLQLQGLLTGDPCRGISRPRVPTRAIHVPSVEQLIEVMERCSSSSSAGPHWFALQTHAMLELLWSTGMRISSLIALDRSDLDLSGRWCRVRVSKGRPQVIPMGRLAVAALRRSMASSPERRDGCDALFVGYHRRRISRQRVELLVREAGRAVGIRLWPHLLRHACASHMLQAGANLRVVQELLGHASVSTTARYSHLRMVDLTRVLQHYHPHGGGVPAEPVVDALAIKRAGKLLQGALEQADAGELLELVALDLDGICG